VFDLDAYLERIGLGPRPGLAEVHRAHCTSIPFENLDPHRGVPVSLAVEDLEEKIVRRGRGGYCFEQNLLLKAALEALGAEVELYLARVRYGAPGVIRPRSHLVLRVADGDGIWHADVGFGHGTPLEPLPFGPGPAREQSGWRYRVVADGPELVLQTVEGGEWVDLYGFLSEHPVPPIDVETINWWTCTHPTSPFVTGLIVSRQDDDGVRITLSDWDGLSLREATPRGRTFTPVECREVPELLASRFGIVGFALAEDGRLRLPA